MARFFPDMTIGLSCLGFSAAAGLVAALVLGLRWNRALQGAPGARTSLLRYLDFAWDAREHYVHMTVGAMRAADRFFETANPAAGLRAPVWSAAALDASMRLALAAPVAALCLSWLFDGHADRTGAALGLLREADPGFRAVAAAVVAWTLLALHRAARAGGWRLGAWLSSVAAAFAAGAFMVGTSDPAALPGLDSGNGTFAGSVALAIATAVACSARGPVTVAAMLTGMTAVAVNGDGALADLVLLTVAVALLPVADAARTRARFTLFSAMYWPGALLAVGALLGVETWMGSPATGREVLWTIGLAPLLQGPFIWLSVTLARATFGHLGDRKAPPPLVLAISNLCGSIALAVLWQGPASAAALIPSACNGVIWIASVVAWAFPAPYRTRLIAEIERPRPLRRSERFSILSRVVWMVFVGVTAGALAVSGLGLCLWFAGSALPWRLRHWW